MPDLLNIWIGHQIVARGEIRVVSNARGEAVYSIQITETIRIPEQPATARRPNHEGPGPLERLLEPQHKRRCRKCSCTDDHPCPGGCYWVSPDLCSNCNEILLDQLARDR